MKASAVSAQLDPKPVHIRTGSPYLVSFASLAQAYGLSDVTSALLQAAASLLAFNSTRTTAVLESLLVSAIENRNGALHCYEPAVGLDNVPNCTVCMGKRSGSSPHNSPARSSCKFEGKPLIVN